MSTSTVPSDWQIANLEACVDILDSQRVPVNNKERQARIQNKAPDELYPYYGATGEVGKIDGYLFDEELVALGEDGVPFLDPRKPKAYILSGKTWINNHAHVLKAVEGLTTNQFLLHYLNQFDYQEYVNGGTRLKLTQANMRRIQFPVPPLAEQKVIADKLDTLLAQVENTKAQLERIPQILKRFRQSVLAAAVSGRLTEMPPASATERVTLGQIAVDIRYGTSKKCSESAGSTPVLRIPNIGDGYINQNNLKFADFDEKERAKLALQQGDLLLIRSNGSLDLVGKTALAQDKDLGLLFAGYLIRVRLDNQIADPAYVSLCLRSPETRAIIEEKAKSTSGVNNINSKELASLELSLPSTEVQQEIVRRVDQLFAHADRIEQQINNALARVNNLTQSILAKAFRGELTEQWRKDNPELISGENSAEALLERIKGERAAMKTANKTRKRTPA